MKKGEKAPTTTPGRVERLVKWMMRFSDSKTALPSDRLFDFFQSQILAVSAELGLLGDLACLSAASDGTPIVTAAYPRSKSTCDCRARSDIQISPKGIPICPKGKEMKPNGTDHKLHRRNWRCTPTCGCSSARFGRTFYTKTSDDPRLFPMTLRDSEKWKLIYKRRTSVERSNKREKIDYKLESG